MHYTMLCVLRLIGQQVSLVWQGNGLDTDGPPNLAYYGPGEVSTFTGILGTAVVVDLDDDYSVALLAVVK